MASSAVRKAVSRLSGTKGHPLDSTPRRDKEKLVPQLERPSEEVEEPPLPSPPEELEGAQAVPMGDTPVALAVRGALEALKRSHASSQLRRFLPPARLRIAALCHWNYQVFLRAEEEVRGVGREGLGLRTGVTVHSETLRKSLHRLHSKAREVLRLRSQRAAVREALGALGPLGAIGETVVKCAEKLQQREWLPALQAVRRVEALRAHWERTPLGPSLDRWLRGVEKAAWEGSQGDVTTWMWECRRVSQSLGEVAMATTAVQQNLPYPSPPLPLTRDLLEYAVLGHPSASLSLAPLHRGLRVAEEVGKEKQFREVSHVLLPVGGPSSASVSGTRGAVSALVGWLVLENVVMATTDGLTSLREIEAHWDTACAKVKGAVAEQLTYTVALETVEEWHAFLRVVTQTLHPLGEGEVLGDIFPVVEEAFGSLGVNASLRHFAPLLLHSPEDVTVVNADELNFLRTFGLPSRDSQVPQTLPYPKLAPEYCRLVYQFEVQWERMHPRGGEGRKWSYRLQEALVGAWALATESATLKVAVGHLRAQQAIVSAMSHQHRPTPVDPSQTFANLQRTVAERLSSAVRTSVEESPPTWTSLGTTLGNISKDIQPLTSSEQHSLLTVGIASLSQTTMQILGEIPPKEVRGVIDSLPRLFAYLSQALPNSPAADPLRQLERLLRNQKHLEEFLDPSGRQRHYDQLGNASQLLGILEKVREKSKFPFRKDTTEKSLDDVIEKLRKETQRS